MNKTKLFLIGGVVIVVAAAVLMNVNRSGEDMSQIQPTPTPEAIKSPVPSKTTSVKQAAEQAELYTDLVKQYEGKRIQFDINCQAIPSSVTYNNNTKVMFDNRSGDARWISIGGTGYQFTGYGYRIITLSSKTLPATLMISCGSAVNVGQILLQQ